MKTKDEIQNALSDEIIDKGMFLVANIAPRAGKCRITLNCLNTKDKVVIAYPETNIKKSWQDDIKRWKFKGKKVKYTTHMSIKKLKEKCDVLVLDEIHLLSKAQLLAASNYIKTFGIEKVIGLTGTLSPETEKDILDVLGLKVMVNYPIDQAVADGVITDYKIEVRFTELSRDKTVLVKWKGGDFYTSEKASFDRATHKIETEQNPGKRKMLRIHRMSIIKKSQSKINLTKKILTENKDKRILTFTGLIDVADGLGIPSYHSKSKDNSEALKFISGESNKLAVVKQLNTGITFNKLSLAVINFFDSNAENMAQKISRITCMEYDTPDKVAHIIITCSTEEQEKIWLNKALAFFDPNKIKYIN